MHDRKQTEPPCGQDAVLTFLSDPKSYPSPPATVERIDTHCAIVFLAGDCVYKIKRAVTYDYIDCSTLDRREKLCRRELDLNRPAAPQIYQDVIPITGEKTGTLALDGSGLPVEWAVRMHRFKEECVFENMAENGTFTLQMAGDLGAVVARSHERAPVMEDLDGFDLITEILDELVRVFQEMPDLFDTETRSTFDTGCRRHLQNFKQLLNDRAKQGFVRRCHGDLHLRNIVRIGTEIVPFDALEFDERLATTDILYDLAFLLMDVMHRQLPDHANLTFNTYFQNVRNVDALSGLALLPLFLSIRAGIRAMVSGQASLHDQSHVPALREDAKRYMEQAKNFLAPSAPHLVCIGGLSGTGKSVLAASLAPLVGPAPGALHLRSDVERKHLFGVSATTHLDARCYNAEVTQMIYKLLRTKARMALAAGHSVILDAVYQTEEERHAVADLAQSLNVGFHGLWLHADQHTLINRVQSRIGDASDADAAVVKKQLQKQEGSMTWNMIDASGTPSESLSRATDTIGTGPAENQVHRIH